MKKIRNLLLSALLLLGAGSFIFATKQSKNSVAVDASRHYHTTGMYERVTDIDRLENNDKVIIVINGNEVLSYFGGNPASAQFPSDGVYVSNDGLLIGLEDSLATEFTLWYDSSTNQYQFNGTMEMGSYNDVYDVLLAHVPYDTPTGFPAIGYFTGDRFGAYQNTSSSRSDSKTHWTLTYSGGTRENILLTNVYTSDCARSYAIYRKVDSKSFYGRDNDMTYRNYYVGDDLNLTNFYVEVMDGVTNITTYLYYLDNQDMFYFTGSSKAVANQTEYSLKLHGLVDDTFTLEINTPKTNPNYYYQYVTPGALKDYRGTYLVVEQEEETRYFNARFPVYDDNNYDGNSTACEINNGVISNSTHLMLDNALIIDKVEINGKNEYVAKTLDLFPQYYNNPYYNEQWPGSQVFIELTDEYSESNIITIKENPNGGMTFGFTSKYDDFFGFSYNQRSENFFFETVDHYQNARLYKINKVDYFDEHIASFIEKFEEQTQYCDATGSARTVFEHHWDKIEMEFSALNPDVKGYLANLTYTHNAETPHTIQDIIDRYDFLIGKYNDLSDFLDRKAAQTWQSHVQESNISVFNSNESSMNSTVIILVVCVTSMSLLTFVILKRKKQGNLK